MSYGCAGRRDERRKGAIERTTVLISRLKADLSKPQSDEWKKILKSKLERAEETLRNTQANNGKGTSALTK